MDQDKTIERIASELKVIGFKEYSIHVISEYIRLAYSIGYDYARNENGRRGRTVIQLDRQGNFVKEWSNPYSAQRGTGINVNNIYAVCNGRRISTGKFKWMYKDDIEVDDEI